MTAQICVHSAAAAPRCEPAVALSTAQRQCEARGERWTEPRRRTYELLVQAGRPVKAYDLIAAYKGKGQATTAPPTVYRALEFLLAQGFAHRIESLNAFVACRETTEAHVAGFLICDCCGRAEELQTDAVAIAAAEADARCFRLDRTMLELRGRCPACRGA